MCIDKFLCKKKLNVYKDRENLWIIFMYALHETLRPHTHRERYVRIVI